MLNVETLKTHKATGILYRPETDDSAVISERKDYGILVAAMTKDDVVLDAGGHIGITACLFSPKVKQVITVEPDIDNLKLLKMNVQKQNCQNVYIVEGVVTPEDGEYQLWLNQKKGQCAHSLAYRRGREAVTVQGFSFDRLLDAYKPSFLKFDIEGGEYNLIDRLTNLPRYVHGIALELHFNQKDWRYELAPRLHEGLLMSGFTAVAEPEWDTNWRGTTPTYMRLP